MAKKNLASLMNGIMGDDTQDARETIDNTAITETPEQETAEVTDEMKQNLESTRRRNVGRPRKGTPSSKQEETRATFIVSPEVIRKLKYIALVDGTLLKDIIAEALDTHIAAWESENGKIRLPKKKL